MYSLCSLNGAGLLHLHGARTRPPPSTGPPTPTRGHHHCRPTAVPRVGRTGAAKHKGTAKKYIKNKQEQCKPRFSWRERRGKASSRCPVLPQCHLTPLPVPGPSQTPLRGRPPRRNGKVRSTHPRPRPTTAGGRVDKQTQRPPGPLSVSFLLFLPSPRLQLQLPLAAPLQLRACLRAPRWPWRTARGTRRARGPCGDLRPSCHRWPGEAASAFTNVSSRHTRGGGEWFLVWFRCS